MKQTYSEWMAQVDAIVSARVGVSVHDLEDFCSRDLYESGATPSEAADEAIENDSLFCMF